MHSHPYLYFYTLVDFHRYLLHLQEVRKVKSMLTTKFSEQIYYGYWFSPEGEYTRSCIDMSQKDVEGKVTLAMFKGQVRQRAPAYSVYTTLDSLESK